MGPVSSSVKVKELVIVVVFVDLKRYGRWGSFKTPHPPLVKKQTKHLT